MNVALLLRVRDYIIENPGSVDMGSYAHEKVACICGLAAILSHEANWKHDTSTDFEDPKVNNLGLDLEQSDLLFLPGEWPPYWNAQLLLHRFEPRKAAHIIASRIDHFIYTGGRD